MSQPNFYQVDGDDNGATYNVKLQDLISALTTSFSGDTAPTTTFANMEWYDTSTSPPTKWKRDTSNTTWDKIGQFSNNTYYGSVTGSSGSTAKLNTARAISISGDASGSTSFDGSANANIALTLANSGVTAGTYGGTNKTLQVTVDSKGRITGVSVASVTYPVTSFNGRTGALSLTQSDVYNALPSSNQTNGNVLKTTGSALYWAPDNRIDTVNVVNTGTGNAGTQLESVELQASVSGNTLSLTLINHYGE